MLPIVQSAVLTTPGDTESKMPVFKGKVGDTTVDTLRDTGCSGVVVREKFVKKDLYTGKYC